jgi:hypothetical protein
MFATSARGFGLERISKASQNEIANIVPLSVHHHRLHEVAQVLEHQPV